MPPAVALLNYISCGIPLEDFLPNWDISRGFLYISLILPFIYVPLPNRTQCEFNMNVYNTINSLNIGRKDKTIKRKKLANLGSGRT